MSYKLRYRIIRARNRWLESSGVHVPHEWRMQEWIAEMKLQQVWRHAFANAERNGL